MIGGSINSGRLVVQNDADEKEDYPLSSTEWRLLTYIVRTYDVDTAIQMCQHSKLQRKRKTLNLKYFQEHKRSKFTPLNLLNTDQSLLKSNQWTLLSNIIHTYDIHSAIPIIQRILSKQSSRQPKLRFKMKHTFDIINKFFQSLRLFIDHIISHTFIDENCQQQILKQNFHSVACLNGLFIGRETYLLHNRAHSINFSLIYNENSMLITSRLIYQLEHNEIVFKLFIVILLFSTNLSIVNYTDCEEIKNYNEDKLNQYENIFIDLLWKYMLYKYDFQECVHRFSTMIKIILDLLDQLYQTKKLHKTKQ